MFPIFSVLIICEDSSHCNYSLSLFTNYLIITASILDNLYNRQYNDTVGISPHSQKEENIHMKKEIKSSLGLNNMNGITTDDDRTCGLQDMNCLETQSSILKAVVRYSLR